MVTCAPVPVYGHVSGVPLLCMGLHCWTWGKMACYISNVLHCMFSTTWVKWSWPQLLNLYKIVYCILICFMCIYTLWELIVVFCVFIGIAPVLHFAPFPIVIIPFVLYFNLLVNQLLGTNYCFLPQIVGDNCWTLWGRSVWGVWPSFSLHAVCEFLCT